MSQPVRISLIVVILTLLLCPAANAEEHEPDLGPELRVRVEQQNRAASLDGLAALGARSLSLVGDMLAGSGPESMDAALARARHQSPPRTALGGGAAHNRADRAAEQQSPRRRPSLKLLPPQDWVLSADGAPRRQSLGLGLFAFWHF